MCGRFTLTTPGEILAEIFELAEVPELSPRYNIAPTQPIATVRLVAEPKVRRLDQLRWGLIPSWAKDPAIGNRMINARAETVSEKPAYRSAFRRRRCLVPADGFYEWRKTGASKQPFLVRKPGGQPFAMAGLWETWKPPGGGDPVESCAIITTDANDFMRPIHNRMPVIVERDAYGLWLDPGTDPAKLRALLRPCANDALEAYRVSRHVNDPRNDDPQCVAPAPSESD